MERQQIFYPDGSSMMEGTDCHISKRIKREGHIFDENIACYFDDEDDPSHPNDSEERVQESSTTHTKDSEGITSEPTSKKKVDVVTAVEIISKHLCNDAKFAKAGELFCKLVNAELCDTNSSTFFIALCKVMCECASRDVTNKLYGPTYVQIFELLCSRLANFNAADRFSIETYALYAYHRNLMLTDDSFQFAKSVASVKRAIESLKSQYADEDERTQHEERQRVLVCCIESALSNYRWVWARQPCDSLISLASERRFMFAEDIRDQLDEYINSAVAAQRKNVSSTGPRTFRAYNSNSHPLRSVKKDYGAV